jgi:hypothetical protein
MYTVGVNQTGFNRPLNASYPGIPNYEFFSCSRIEDFKVDMGEIRVIGPSPVRAQDRTCVAGQTCRISAILGYHLSSDDRMIVLDTCGAAARTGLLYAPLAGEIATLAATRPSASNESHASGLPYATSLAISFGTTRLTSPGGSYRICWCAAPSGADVSRGCTTADQFRADVGRLTIVGPAHPFRDPRTCVAGRRCGFDGFMGHYLNVGDQVMVLETCGTRANHPHYQVGLRALDDEYRAAGASRASSVSRLAAKGGVTMAGSGLSVHWGVIPWTVSGGQYRMCWCAGTFDCLRADEFAVDLGELVIVGPARREARTCVSGQTCSIDTLTGSLLDDESAVVVLDTCGAATVVPRLPDGGHMTPRAGTRGLGLFYVRNAEEANRTYSSVFNNDVAGSGYARSVLGSEQAWSAGAGQANEWVQLDLGEFKFVRAVITQGRKQPPERILTVTDGHPNSYASAGEYFGFANAQADMVFGEISWDGQAFPARANNRTGTVILFRDNLNCGMSCGRWVEWLPLYTQEAAGVLDGNIRGEHDAPHRRRLPDSERTPYLQGAGDWSVADTINIYP